MDSVVSISKLIGDNSRAAILTALMSDKALTPGELSVICNVTPQTISSHLNKLVEGGLVSYTTASRHKYCYLKSDSVANLLETIYQLSPTHQNLTIPRHNKINPELRFGRTCYNHMAGYIAINLTQKLLQNGCLTFDGQFHISAKGGGLFNNWGLPLDSSNMKANNESQQLIKPCMDWTERKFHIGGLIGKLILETFIANKWLAKGNIHRSLHLTQLGKNLTNSIQD